MRRIAPAESTITEEVWQGEEHIVTELTRIGNSNAFSVSDRGRTFSGKVVFSGDNWRWTSWTYDIAMSDGSGKLLGKGWLSESSITTNKRFLSPDGVVRAIIVEKLEGISEDQFRKLRLEKAPPY